MKLILLSGILTLAIVQAWHNTSTESTTNLAKRSYVCPPHFIRLSHRCYFFSDEAATWHQAYFHCQELHANLAVIRNFNQDNLIRKTLSNKLLAPSERWLGGLYDWEQMRWKWGGSGKSLVYKGFSQTNTTDKEKLRWHCIVLDPVLQYKWNIRSCLDPKKFICHTKIKAVARKDKKRKTRQYKLGDYKKPNEIPVPILKDSVNFNSTNYNKHHTKNIHLNYAKFSFKPRARKRRNRTNKSNKGKYYEPNDQANGRKFDEETKARIKWKTYFKHSIANPLHPKAIVEEFNYVKQY